MFLSAIPLEQVSEADLQRLIAEGVRENRDLEFKREVGATREAKQEFLKDVISFANTAGGHLIIGMDAEAGVASALTGLKRTQTADSEKLRLENLVRDGVEPRLVGVRIHEVSLPDDNYALVIKIPASWNPPHRVSYNGANRFYARNSAGAYELSVEQIRSAFLGGAELERRLDDFRLTRLARLGTDQGGVGISGKGKLIVQTVPLATRQENFDLSGINKKLHEFLPPRAVHGINYRYNMDGFLLHGATRGGDPPTSYTQVFRNGCVEIAVGDYVYSRDKDGKQRLLCDGPSLSREMAGAIETAIAASFSLGATPPIAVMVSFTEGIGSILRLGDGLMAFPEKVLDRNALLFAPVVVQEAPLQQGWQKGFRPVFDSLWNAFGYPRCDSLFDNAGNWTGIPTRWQ